MRTDERIERAGQFYVQAVLGGDLGGLPVAERELDGVEADLALARGRVLHAVFLEKREVEDPRELALFERAAELYRALGDVRGEGEALFWIGIVHQVVRDDGEAAVPVLERSLELATQAGDRLTMSYALRHLGFAEHAAGRLSTAREQFEESVRLRRELGFQPGVAANLVGLAYIAAEEGDRAKALRLIEEAGSLAVAAGAHGILRHVEAARGEV